MNGELEHIIRKSVEERLLDEPTQLPTIISL
jgi:hypothetical protein